MEVAPTGSIARKKSWGARAVPDPLIEDEWAAVTPSSSGENRFRPNHNVASFTDSGQKGNRRECAD